MADPGVHTGNCSEKLILDHRKATDDSVWVLEGRDISRYACARPRKKLRLGYTPKSGEYFTIRDRARYESAHFVIRQTAAEPIVGPRLHAIYFRNSLLALYDPDDATDPRYIVAVLNSSLIRFIYRAAVQEAHQRAFPQVKVSSIRDLPIYWPDQQHDRDARYHRSIVALVDRMLSLQQVLATARTDHEKAALQRQIEATDREIDALVYELYGLTDAEIKIVEEATT